MTDTTPQNIPNSSTTQHIYYPRLHRVWLILSVIYVPLSFLYLLLFLFWPSTDVRRGEMLGIVLTYTWLAMFVAFLLMAVVFYYSAKQIRLVVSPEGIEYHQIGCKICTVWDNIQYIGLTPTRFIPTEAIVLRQPGLQGSLLWAWNPILKDQDRIIPLEMVFDKQWRYKGLGQDIERYAPQLMRDI